MSVSWFACVYSSNNERSVATLSIWLVFVMDFRTDFWTVACIRVAIKNESTLYRLVRFVPFSQLRSNGWNFDWTLQTLSPNCTFIWNVVIVQWFDNTQVKHFRFKTSLWYLVHFGINKIQNAWKKNDIKQNFQYQH